jgi:hypothetical protein
MSGNKFEYERAKSYWISYIDNALDDRGSPLLSCTIGDTISALEPYEDDEEDDEEEYYEEDESA